MRKLINQALTLLDHLNTFTPYAVGFDRLFDQLASSSRVTSSYPPYNIIRENDYDFKIEIYTNHTIDPKSK